ncbi:MAG: hypothetical protein R3C61_05415 [Bacteroidia bacterium]
MEQIAEILGEVLKYSVPALLVLLAVRWTQEYHARRDREAGTRKLRRAALEAHLPLKLSAYERAVLYLERISPENLIPRVGVEGKNVSQMERALLQEIVSEYEHNLVQQLYISFTGWSALVSAKNAMVQVVRESAAALPGDANALVLSKKIVETCAEWEDQPTHKAAFVLKSDVLKIFSFE